MGVKTYFGVLLCLTTGALSVDITEFRVGPYWEVGTEYVLDCVYGPEGQGISSVRWYRDDVEFYRYSPDESPQQRTFDIGGVSVDLSRSDSRELVVLVTSERAAGRYTCEVSSGPPSFQLVKYSGDAYVRPPRHEMVMMSSGGYMTSAGSPWMLLLLTMLVAIAARLGARQ